MTGPVTAEIVAAVTARFFRIRLADFWGSHRQRWPRIVARAMAQRLIKGSALGIAREFGARPEEMADAEAIVRAKAAADPFTRKMLARLEQEIAECTVPPPSIRTVLVGDIITLVAQAFRLDARDLTGRERAHSIAWPRQIAMALAREYTGLSTVKLGKLFGGRDHTTVIFACNQVAAREQADPEIAAEVNALRFRIEAQDRAWRNAA